MKLTNGVKGWLDKLNIIQPGFKVQNFLEFPCPWVEYGTPEFEAYLKKYKTINHREILKNEIVIDVDSEEHEAGRFHGNRVEKALQRHNIYYRRYISGGDGEHFHMLYPELRDKKYDKTRDLIKYTIIEYLLYPHILKPNDIKSHICLVNKKLIQIENMPHRKGGVKRLKAHNNGYNTITEDMWKFINEKLDKRKRITEKTRSLPEPDNLNCIKFIEGHTVNGYNIHDIKDGMNRALFILMSYYKNKYKGDEVKDKLIEWYEGLPLDWKRKSVLTTNKRVINYNFKKPHYVVTCNYRIDFLEELKAGNVCKGCPFYIDEK